MFQDLQERNIASSERAAVGYQRTLEKMRFSKRVKMTPAQWYLVPTNPVQRDTEAHAKRAIHLLDYSPEHSIVKMARLPNGATFKLDGHTRAFLWQSGKVKPPRELQVDVFECDDISSVEKLYSHYDSRHSVETATDQITGAVRRAGIVFTSPWMKYGRFGSAVKRLYTFAHKDWSGDWKSAEFVHEVVNAYANELRLLDSVTPDSRRFPGGIVMAALATFKRRGEAATEFWSRYANDGGRKDGLHCDGVQALTDLVSGARRTSVKGTPLTDLLFNRGVTAFEGFRRSDLYKVGAGGGVRNTRDENLLAYVRAHLSEGRG